MDADILLIAVCEDEDEEYETLLNIINTSNVKCEVYRYRDGTDFVRGFYKGKFDLVFMDIYMENMNGIEAVDKMHNRDKEVPVAFITTSKDHAMDGFRLHVNRYLNKPLDKQEVYETIWYAQRQKKLKRGVTLHLDGRDVTLPYAQIRYIEQNNHFVRYNLTGGRMVEMRGKLDDLHLPIPPFIRCHQSYIANITLVSRFDEDLNTLEMMEGGTVYVRRKSIADVRKAYEDYMFASMRDGEDEE